VARTVLYPHSFYHYSAEQLLEKGVTFTVVFALLGHENLQTTAVYLDLRSESLREAVDKLEDPRDEEGNGSSKTQNEKGRDISDHKSLRAHVEKLAELMKGYPELKRKRPTTKTQHWELIQLCFKRAIQNLRSRRTQSDPLPELTRPPTIPVLTSLPLLK